MKKIQLYAEHNGETLSLKSMRVSQADASITDEPRNTVYNVLRKIPTPPLAVWDEFNWNEALWQ